MDTIVCFTYNTMKYSSVLSALLFSSVRGYLYVVWQSIVPIVGCPRHAVRNGMWLWTCCLTRITMFSFFNTGSLKPMMLSNFYQWDLHNRPTAFRSLSMHPTKLCFGAGNSIFMCMYMHMMCCATVNLVRHALYLYS